MNKIIGNTLLWLLAAGLLTGCSTPKPELAEAPEAPRHEPPSRSGNPGSYEVFGKRYVVSTTSEGYREQGIASWYGEDFHGRRTSSGVPYDMYAVTAAHKTLPIPTYVRVTRLDTGRSIVVRVNDRGPFVDGRIIDLSYGAAAQLGIIGAGTTNVEVVALPPYQILPGHTPGRAALARNDPPPALRPHVVAEPALPPLRLVAASVEPGARQPEPARLYLQIGAFTERTNAERLQHRLAGRVRRAVAIESAGERLHRVRIGPLQDLREAESLGAELAILGIDKPQVVLNQPF